MGAVTSKINILHIKPYNTENAEGRSIKKLKIYMQLYMYVYTWLNKINKLNKAERVFITM